MTITISGLLLVVAVIVAGLGLLIAGLRPTLNRPGAVAVTICGAVVVVLGVVALVMSFVS